jgi:hypothetical protein
MAVRKTWLFAYLFLTAHAADRNVVDIPGLGTTLYTSVELHKVI